MMVRMCDRCTANIKDNEAARELKWINDHRRTGGPSPDVMHLCHRCVNAFMDWMGSKDTIVAVAENNMRKKRRRS